jgi:hypothetical protein
MKRYQNESQILKDVEKARKDLSRHLSTADNYDLVANHQFLAGPEHVENAGFNREQAKKCRRKAYRIENNRLPFLKQKLAEFQTPMLPAIDDGDPSISASARRHSRKPELPKI